MKIKNLKNYTPKAKEKSLRYISLGLIVLLSISGCTRNVELAPSSNIDKAIAVSADRNALETPIRHEIAVEGEDFELIIEYASQPFSEQAWQITSDNQLFYHMYTRGLKDGMQVYIDNIHMEVYITSDYATLNGVLQYSMDDRVHGTPTLGFLINNNRDKSFFGCTQIKGTDKNFMEGFISGCNGYITGSIGERKLTEADMIVAGVTGQKITAAIDLAIMDAGDVAPRYKTVESKFSVERTPIAIRFANVNKDGAETVFSVEELQARKSLSSNYKK